MKLPSLHARAKYRQNMKKSASIAPLTAGGRRVVRAGFTGGMAALLCGGAAALHAGDRSIQPIMGDPVQTESGRIAGTQLPSGVRAYLGIPFAAPPVGDLRW
ncbi:MAG TPA: carboxylesterase family protein, partial [Novosphingobium sp.]|nr:carboxylesterase family protein [Novosphingobium sp.]